MDATATSGAVAKMAIRVLLGHDVTGENIILTRLWLNQHTRLQMRLLKLKWLPSQVMLNSRETFLSYPVSLTLILDSVLREEMDERVLWMCANRLNYKRERQETSWLSETRE